MRRLSAAGMFALAVLATGCGYVMAGTWEDDPKNWSRAFQSDKPPDVTVLHSKYWRSAHWSYEFAYFFEIAPNAALKDQLFSRNKLRRLEAAGAKDARKHLFSDVPSWFAPKADAGYDVFVYESEPDSNFRVFIDRKSGAMFLTDYQL